MIFIFVVRDESEMARWTANAYSVIRSVVPIYRYFADRFDEIRK